MREAEDWKRLEELFDRACAVPEDQREAFARQHAGDNPELLSQLLKMLAAVAAATQAVRQPMEAWSRRLKESIAPPEPGDRFGPWKVDKLIGCGGMGRVYLGHRADGTYEQNVAIKVIASSDHDTRRRSYFEFERQMLAHMHHPVIAQIFDAGSDDSGRLYLVMEYVEGQPLTRWCEVHQLSLRSRVELLIRIAEGVQHAHQKGVVHRDLKPSNILIGESDGRIQPKIIDFGIAARASSNPQDEGDVAGTPGYMSPEQATVGLDVDSRSDVYSLGAILFELVSGKRPPGVTTLDGSSGNAALRPSSRIDTLTPEEISTLSASLHLPPKRLRRLVRDDLDWIVAKATEPDRELRYPSVSAMAADLQRWLDGYPPTAVPRQRLRVVRKFIARNRLGVAAFAGLSIAIIGGLFGMGWAWHQAENARQLAEQASRREKATSDFLTGVLTSVDPAISYELDQTLMRKVLDQASARVQTELAEQPEAQANIELTLGYTYVNLGDMQRASDHVDSALRVARERLGQDSLPALLAVLEKGNLLMHSGKPDLAEALYRDTLPYADTHRQVDPVLAPRMKSRLGWILFAQGRHDEASPLLKQAYETLLERVGPDHVRTIDAGQYYAAILAKEKGPEEAIALTRELVERQTRLVGAEHPQTMALRNSLAAFSSEAGQWADAIREYRELIDILRRQHGTSHRMLPTLQVNLATALFYRGAQDDQAEVGELYTAALESHVASQGADNPNAITIRRLRADWLFANGHIEDALDEREALLDSVLKVFGEKHELAPNTLSALAETELALNRREAAARYAERAHTLLQTHHPDNQDALQEARSLMERALSGADPAQEAAP